MKKIAFFLCVLAFSATAFAWDLRTGTYDLYGVSPGGGSYKGQVVISRQGDNYKVIWYIGANQTQVGIGIHRSWDSVFSVAFADHGKGYWGTVSYKVNALGDIEGAWTGSDGYNQGTETLKWVSYSTN